MPTVMATGVTAGALQTLAPLRAGRERQQPLASPQRKRQGEGVFLLLLVEILMETQQGGGAGLWLGPEPHYPLGEQAPTA